MKAKNKNKRTSKQIPPRVPPRLEPVVKNKGIKPVKKVPKHTDTGIV